jgi:hypothetical protein
MKKTLLAVALTAASFTAVADMSISGHANLKAGSLEDFQSGGVAAVQGNEGLTVGDANSSGSRFRIVSSTEANGITYGAKLEFGYSIDGINNRVNEVSAGGSFGKLTLGKGSIAGDGASEEDFSGTYVTSGDLSSWELGGDLAQNVKSDPGRAERLRYDAPKLGNLALSVSINDAAASAVTFDTGTGAAGQAVTVKKAATTGNDEGNDVSVAARYALSNIAASVAVVNAEADNSDQVAASIAGQMASFNAAVQYYTKESGTAGVNNDFEQTRFVVGYKTGPFSLAVDYAVTETDTKSIDAETTGLNFVYNAAKGVELYAGARNAQANNGVEDENAFLMGARVKF